MQICVVLMDEAGCIHYRTEMSLVFPLLVVEHSSPSSDLLNYELVNSMVHLLVNLLIVLTFGLASPYLGIAIVSGMCIRTDLFIFLSHRYVFRSSSPNRSTSSSTSLRSLRNSELELSLLSLSSNILSEILQPESTDTDPRVAPFDLKSSVSVSFLLFSLLIGLFWAFQTVDMVGDVYGSGTGMLAATVVSVYPLLYCLVLLKFNYKIEESNEKYNHLETDKSDEK